MEFTLYTAAEDYWYHALATLIERAGKAVDGLVLVWLSFDIDALKSSVAPAICIPQIAGITAFQTVEPLTAAKVEI